MKILIPQKITRAGEIYLEERGYEVVRGSGFDEDIIAGEARDADGIIIRNAKIGARVMDAAPKLKVIGRHGVGTESIDLDYAEKLGIWVTISLTANYNAVAEQTIEMILACARRSREIELRFRLDREYDVGDRLLGTEVKGKTLGILGLGKVGKSLAQKAALGLEMKVVGFDAYADKASVPPYIGLRASMEQVLAEADFLSLHIPLNEETRLSFGMREFCLMKKTAYFINTARRELMRESELAKALREGVIAGGALDYIKRMPEGEEDPLLDFPNLIVTPHTAAMTAEAMDNMGLQAAEGVHEVLSGQIPSYPVNRPPNPRK